MVTHMPEGKTEIADPIAQRTFQWNGRRWALLEERARDGAQTSTPAPRSHAQTGQP